MKKKISALILSVICTLCAVCALAGCGEETGISRKISKAEEEKICAIYSDAGYPVDSITYYYGNYRGTYVACMGFAITPVNSTETVDGVKFVYPSPAYIFAFRDGEMYTMQEAVDKNYLSHSDIEDIHAISLEQKIAME